MYFQSCLKPPVNLSGAATSALGKAAPHTCSMLPRPWREGKEPFLMAIRLVSAADLTHRTPSSFPSLSPSLDLHPQPFPDADESVSTLASIRAHLMKGPCAGFTVLCLAPGFSSPMGEKWPGLHLCREAGFHFHLAASLTFDVRWLCKLLAAAGHSPVAFCHVYVHEVM